MDTQLLKDIAKSLVVEKKGIFAADASIKTLTKRFGEMGLALTPELNLLYRQIIFSTPEIEEYLSGIILFEDTAKQNIKDGKAIPSLLSEKGILPGIKVDGGLEEVGEETLTKGLEGLPDRLKGYKDLGLKFTKWRAAFKITDLCPSDQNLDENLTRMAEYAFIAQENGFVPIVEPEVLLEGNHTTTRCEEITSKTLGVLFEKLNTKGVSLKGLILKVNMVLPGKDSGVKAAPLEVANATLRTLNNSVPAEVTGVVFLSGGQTPEEATKNLNELERLGKDAPWPLSFSFERGLEADAMNVWQGKEENANLVQETFLKRLKAVSLARQGLYNG
ncbi:fructose-bisphosphate aldolase class I [Candidatus Woesebacteria bacterium]|nr:fructose-bisphosphate aldolase class I [Candidatus Woesebacteria bacterium]